MKYAIGIDIGGTKISIVMGTEKGKILARREIPTKTGSGTRDCVKNLTVNLRSLIIHSRIAPKKILGIGVGCPGAINSVKSTLPRSPNLPGWAGLPLKTILSKATGLPVHIANDANAAALGENLFGAGKNEADLIYITVSTGVGGGILLQGQLYEGAGSVAGEIGHMSIVPEGERCGCGKYGCLEVYASGTAIARYYRKAKKKKVSGAKEVGKAAREGDKTAIQSYQKAGYYLGIGIANLLNVLNPGKVVIGGGVLKSAHPVFWKTMIRSSKQHAWPEAFRTTRIVKSPLLGRSGDLGALALVFKNSR